MSVRPMYADPYNPTMRASESLVVSVEQQNLIRQVLDYSASDSLFAKKAYSAIYRILTEGSVLLPVVESISPDNAKVGDPAFQLTVTGTGFDQDAVINFGGEDVVTVRQSETSLNCNINLNKTEPVGLPVFVKNGSGLVSNGMTFDLQAASTKNNQAEVTKQIKESNDLNRELHKKAVGVFDNTLKDRSFSPPPAKNDAYKRDPKMRHTTEDVRKEQIKTETHNQFPIDPMQLEMEKKHSSDLAEEIKKEEKK